jgi:hypothetical protein
MEIVINKCYGGFGISHEAIMLYAKKKGIQLFPFIDKKPYDFKNQKFVAWDGKETPPMNMLHYATQPLTSDGKYIEDSYWGEYSLERSDPILIEVIKELGDKANGWAAKLQIVEIPDGIDWYMDDYDGIESIHENHQSW